MKKTKLLTIPVLAAMLFAGCASAPTEPANKAPSVVGVKDVQCIVNSTVDFLDGVAALDTEDGDITPELEITVSPHVEVKDGYARFDEVGEYSVNYKITDSEGRTAQKRAFVDVVDRETYRTFNMPEGFEAFSYGAASIENCGMVNGNFVLKAEGGQIAEDIVLSRTYAMSDTYDASSGKPCTFIYTVNSNAEGKIKVMADGSDCAEARVVRGENVISFTCFPALDKDGNPEDIAIDLCLGGLGSVDWVVKGVECDYPQKKGLQVDRTVGFSFTGKVLPRIDTEKGPGLEGNAFASQDGAEAHLEITKASTKPDALWCGGMFINTEIALKEGVEYTVSFDIKCEHEVREEENNYEILFQFEQWTDDSEVIKKAIKPSDGKVEETLNIDAAHVGSLWIYVQSGTQKNMITLSGLKVYEKLGDAGKDIYEIGDFTSTPGKTGTLTTDKGNFIITGTGGDVEIMSQSFLVAGSGANYAITFKAKASAPVSMVVAIPVAGGWDPTILWQQVTVTEDWTIFTFMCNGSDSDRLHKIAWQINPLSDGVTVEITDVRVCLKNNQLDG